MKLTDEQLPSFAPTCQVCGKPVPDNRKHNSNLAHTCSPECQAAWRKWKKYSTLQKRCIACLRPSSPQEREDYRAWRRSRGQLRSELGRPPIRRERKLSEALERTVALLELRLQVVAPESEESKVTKKAISKAHTALRHAKPGESDADPAENEQSPTGK